MFTYAFLHNGCLNELREGNIQLFTLQICGKILLLKVLNFSEVERILLYVTVTVMLRSLSDKARGNVSLLIVFIIVFVSHPTEVHPKQKMDEVACGITL